MSMIMMHCALSVAQSLIDFSPCSKADLLGPDETSYSVGMDSPHTSVTQALHGRISVRSFRDTPVGELQLRAILETARWSPSGGNLQPWHVYALSGNSMVEFAAALQVATSENPIGERTEFDMYPKELKDPYRARRFKCGEDLYATIGIPREDKSARLQQMAKNYEFFGAPAALFFAIDRTMGPGQWAHLGMFMQSIALVAYEHGLASCMQEFWMLRHGLVRSFFGIPEELQVYCGMAIGYANTEHPINALRTERAEVDEFTTFAS
jgi:nitroreductase